MTEPMQLLEDLRRAERRAPCLSVRKLMIVALLAGVRAPMQVRDIRKMTGMPKPAVTRNVEELRRLGFVTKSRSVAAGEGRDVMVAITEKGLDLLGPVGWFKIAVAKAGERV